MSKQILLMWFYIARITPLEITKFSVEWMSSRVSPIYYISAHLEIHVKSLVVSHYSFQQPASPSNSPPFNLSSSDKFRLFYGNRQTTTRYRRPKKPIAAPALPLGGSGDSTTALTQIATDAHEASLSLVAAAALSANCWNPIIGRIGIIPPSSVAVVGASALGVGAWNQEWHQKT